MGSSHTARCVLFFLVLASCGSPNELEGSLSEEFTLFFDLVEAYQQDSILRIEYVALGAEGDSRVFRIIVETKELPITSDYTISGDDFVSNVWIDRDVPRDNRRFPPLEGGKLTFEQFDFQDRGLVSGELEAVFEGKLTAAARFYARVVSLEY